MMSLFRRSGGALPEAIEISGRLLPVKVRKSATTRRFILRLDKAGAGVVISMPKRASERDAAKFLETHRGWIAARIAELPPRRDLSPGSTVPFRGEELTILPAPDRPRAVALTRDGLIVGGPEILVPGRVKRFLIREARKQLEARVASLSDTLPRKPGAITIRDTRSRWGSCTSDGRLNFSWRLILAPDFVLDYVVAHELAHLEVFHHGPKFDAATDRITPHRKAARAWLKRHGSGLHAVG